MVSPNWGLKPLLGVTLEARYYLILRVRFLTGHVHEDVSRYERLTRYSLRQFQNHYICLPVLHLTPDGFLWDDLHKILHGGQRMAMVQNGIDTFPEISPA